MVAYFTASVRTLLIAAALAFVSQTAVATSNATTQTQATARTLSAATTQDGFSIDGLLIIAGIVGAVILLAWVCSRIGDSRGSSVIG